MTKRGGLWTRIKGKFVRPVADASGDREAEAKAVLEALTGREPDETALHDVTEQVRERHHDTPSSNPPEPPGTRDIRL